MSLNILCEFTRITNINNAIKRDDFTCIIINSKLRVYAHDDFHGCCPDEPVGASGGIHHLIDNFVI